LLETLRGEGAGILNWMLQGLRDWSKGGLRTPGPIVQSTAAYREEQDVLGEWIAERCISGNAFSVAKSPYIVV